MLTFKKKEENIFALYDDEKEIAWVDILGDTIKSVKYESEQTEKRWGDFTLRSIAYIMRGRYMDFKCDFYDERLERIGFERDGFGMKANALKINFDTCHHGGKK